MYDEEVLLDPMITIWSVGNASDHDSVTSRIGRAPNRDELEITTWELVERGRGVTAVQLVRAVDLIQTSFRPLPDPLHLRHPTAATARSPNRPSSGEFPSPKSTQS